MQLDSRSTQASCTGQSTNAGIGLVNSRSMLVLDKLTLYYNASFGPLDSHLKYRHYLAPCTVAKCSHLGYWPTYCRHFANGQSLNTGIGPQDSHSMKAVGQWTFAQWRHYATRYSLNPSIGQLDYLNAGIWVTDELHSRAMAMRAVDQCRHWATDPRTVTLYNFMPYIYIICYWYVLFWIISKFDIYHFAYYN